MTVMRAINGWRASADRPCKVPELRSERRKGAKLMRWGKEPSPTAKALQWEEVSLVEGQKSGTKQRHRR